MTLVVPSPLIIGNRIINRSEDLPLYYDFVKPKPAARGSSLLPFNCAKSDMVRGHVLGIVRIDKTVLDGFQDFGIGRKSQFACPLIEKQTLYHLVKYR